MEQYFKQQDEFLAEMISDFDRNDIKITANYILLIYGCQILAHPYFYLCD